MLSFRYDGGMRGGATSNDLFISTGLLIVSFLCELDHFIYHAHSLEDLMNSVQYLLIF